MDASSFPDGMSPSEIIGWRLRQERKRLGLTTSQLAKKAGVCRMTATNYETGRRSPDALYLLSVFEAGIDVGYVVTGKRTREAS